LFGLVKASLGELAKLTDLSTAGLTDLSTFAGSDAFLPFTGSDLRRLTDLSTLAGDRANAFLTLV
jgi:hypothetical protein